MAEYKEQEEDQSYKYFFLEDVNSNNKLEIANISQYSDIISLFSSWFETSTKMFSTDQQDKFAQICYNIFISDNTTINKKCKLAELIDILIKNNIIEKTECIFNLILKFSLFNKSNPETSLLIFKCLYDIICPNIIEFFPNDFYEIVKSSGNNLYICRIAEKISKNIKNCNACAKEQFLHFLKEISTLLNEETSLYIYSAHLNAFYFLNDSFPLSDLEFYTKVEAYNRESKLVILKLLSYEQTCYEIFCYPQIQRIILSEIENNEPTQHMIFALRALINILKGDEGKFSDIFLSDHLILILNNLILNFSYNVKSDAGYLLSLMITRFPRCLFRFICGETEGCDIKKALYAVLLNDRIAILIEMLYGIDYMIFFAIQSKLINQFICQIQEFNIYDKIYELAKNSSQEVAKTANIIISRICKDSISDS